MILSSSCAFSWPTDCTSFCAGYDCLKEYVDKPDPNYRWIDTGERIKGVDPLHLVGWTGYVLNFTSQEWLTAGEVSQPLWWHIMIVVVPNNVKSFDKNYYKIILLSVSSSSSTKMRPSYGLVQTIIMTMVALECLIHWITMYK